MKQILKFIVRTLFIGGVFFISCKKELSWQNGKDKNKPPIAIAGADETIILPNNTGSGSTDPDNNISSYLWTKISTPSSFNTDF